MVEKGTIYECVFFTILWKIKIIIQHSKKIYIKLFILQTHKNGKHYQKMCGIIGYLGKCACFNQILDGLKQLQNRGYDSAGISTIENMNHTNDDEYSSISSSGITSGISGDYKFSTSKFASSER